MISPYPPERDGIGVFCEMLSTELAGSEHEIGVISARPSTAPRPEVIGFLPSPPRLDPSHPLDAAMSFRPDVVHLQFAIATYGARIAVLLRLIRACRSADIPVIVTMHEVTRDTDSLGPVARALYRRIAALADRVIVHTEQACSALIRDMDMAPGNVSVVPLAQAELRPGVDGSVLRERYALGSDRIVLSFGFIDVDKGLDDLVRAMALLRGAGALSGVRLVVAGAVRQRFGLFRVFELRDRVHLIKVIRLVDTLQLRRHVTFTGFVQEDEVRAWFELAAAAVLPYRRSEQSGVASLAMAAGTPLLTADIGELGKLSTLEPFPPQDPVALSDRLRRLLSCERDAISRTPRPGNLRAIAAATAELYRGLQRAQMRAGTWA